jgi:phospholipid/cholesterol/gamma-HCH transport system substrate-binding protein
MQKQAPTLPRLLTMTLFALSCFGLLLFLWLSFGGPSPLKPKGYEFRVAFPEATQLSEEADVRIAGVSVGKVRGKDIDNAHRDLTIATIELDPRFAPLHADAKAILRQKTLLGETYVELTPGTRGAPAIKEGGFLANSRVAKTVELDEVFQALDPVTRKSFQAWQQDMATGIAGRGPALNDAFGDLPAFAADTSDVLDVLDAQSLGVRRLIRNTGTVFGAISQNERQLHNLITGSDATFGALARQNDALAQTFKIFPTFLDESKATMAKLETFSTNAEPLIHDLRPVARDLRPTLRATKALAPDLRATFRKLDPLIAVSRKGLPALRDTLTATTPLLGQLQPFLENLNPILQYLEYYQVQTADFISNGAGALADTVPTSTNQEMGHYLRQWGPTGAESAGFYASRPSSERGNAYLPPVWQGAEYAKRMIFPETDCANAGGPVQTPVATKDGEQTDGAPSCWLAPISPVPAGNTLMVPHIQPASYAAPAPAAKKR